ncbi:MAG: prepilin-type N-terminal cleavage/methylation domain-containing protein [Verrucomicrobiota bacterium]
MITVSKKAFTLVEILVVISIIAILAGMTLGVGGSMMDKAKRSRSEGEIAAMEAALERYKIDNGGYPVAEVSPNIENDGDPAEDSYVSGARALFQALCGRKSYKEAAEGQVYYEAKVTQVDKASRTSTEEDSFLVDAWGNAYGYHVNDAESGMNPGFFDLWSTSGKKAIEDKKKWVGNWKN